MTKQKLLCPKINSFRKLLKSDITYSSRQLLTFGHVMELSFSQFSPLLQKNLEISDTSFESPKIELSESERNWA